MENMLMQSVSLIDGIGKGSQEAMHELGIVTIDDLFHYFPYRYEDYSLKNIEEIEHEEKVTIEGKVQSDPILKYYGKKKSRLSFRLLVERYLIHVIFFNQPYLKSKIQPGDTVIVSGKWDRHKATLTAKRLLTKNELALKQLEPVYTLGQKLKMTRFRAWMFQAFKQFGPYIEETFPKSHQERYKLISKKSALYYMHFPKTHEHAKQARRRIAYEELLLFQLKMQVYRKIERERTQGQPFIFSDDAIQQFVQALPFTLTNAQQRVIREIMNDLKSGYQMNRLVQGDVGSGKTVVAAVSMYAAKLANYQSALMVPTEILAEQHAESLTTMFADYPIRVELLTSRVKGKKRKALLEALCNGEIDLLIGTHALIQDEVNFQRLGLVITDEQHRFGVNQRKVLREKGENPNVLFMTATPIPRTLALTTFGDMDVSSIDEMPKGRKPVKTVHVKHEAYGQVLSFVERELQKGHQAYVICPLIEESEKLDLQNAIDVYEGLKQHFKTYQVGLMHGRLSSDEKDAVMEAFSANKVNVLVSTTVVEVGVNVPNATTMVIYDAERFGLAQLHQLRGRVGRASFQSYCILIADPKSEIGKERMLIMTQTTNGFELAERDLELRGPGDFFGSKQSGLPQFKVADIVHDYRMLAAAQKDATVLVTTNELFQNTAYVALKEELERTGIFDEVHLD